MKRNDYLLVLSSGLLMAPDDKLDETLNLVGQQYELYEPGKPQTVSLGVIDSAGKISGFAAWMKSLRKQKIQRLKISCLSHQREGLPAHMAAAFAGAEDYVMEISTPESHRAYVMKVRFSPAYQLSGQDFIDLIDAQKNKAQLWDRITELVSEFVQMNAIDGFHPSGTREFLLSAEGQQVFEFMTSQLIQEVQIESQIYDVAFKIPPAQKELFFLSDPPFGEQEKDPVFLYPVKEVNADQLLLLVREQGFEEEIWNALEHECREYPQEEIPSLKASEWPGQLKNFHMALLQQVSGIVCRVIAVLCEEREIKPVIPPALKDVIGPDELEEKRAQARSKPYDLWLLDGNKDPWEIYYYEEVPGFISEPVKGMAEAQKEFLDALQKAENFAVKIQSPFEEAFKLGAYFLSGKVPAGHFDHQHGAAIEKDLKQKGYSDRALENAGDVVYYGEVLEICGWPADKIYGILSLSISDVFGGMGSWNDLYMETEEENQIYQEVSSKLFESLKSYFAALLSVERL
ncbi:MAG: hypothetical protein ACJ75J_10680 [Cytophagaceae bacterium]